MKTVLKGYSPIRGVQFSRDEKLEILLNVAARGFGLLVVLFAAAVAASWVMQ